MVQAWSVRVGCPLDRWSGQDSGTSLVSEGGMSMDVHWTGGVDRTVVQAWSVRVGCPLDRWSGQDSGTSLVCVGGMSMSHRHSLNRWTTQYPHIYLTSHTSLFLPGLSPPFVHTASDQKLEAGTAWERGYSYV